MPPVFESGKREKAHQKGEDYKKAVREYMESEGYMLVEDSNVHGGLTDLVFTHKATGERVYVESKGSEKSPVTMNSQIAEYFLMYINRKKGDRPDVYIFVEKLSNRDLWLGVFDRSPDSDVVEDYYRDKVEGIDEPELKEGIEATDESDFKEFILDTYVYERRYHQLLREAERNSDDERFDYEPYLKNYSPISEESNLSTNIFKITQFPDILYSVDLGDKDLDVYNQDFADYRPVSAHEDTLYTLREPASLDDEILNALHQNEVTEHNFKDWIDSHKGDKHLENIIKELLRKLTASIAHENNCRVLSRRGSSIIYPELKRETHGEKRKMNGIWVAKSLDKYDEIRHRAVRIQVKKFGEEFYYIFSPTQEFTRDGADTVSGPRKKKLQDKFSPNRYPEQNLKKLREVQSWKSILMPGETLSQFSAGQDTPMTQMRIEQVSNLSLDVRPPEDSEERDQIVTGEK